MVCPLEQARVDAERDRGLARPSRRETRTTFSLWAISSEVDDTTAGRDLATKLNALAHAEDPTRPTTLSTNKADNAAQ